MRVYVGFPVAVAGHVRGEPRYHNLHITLAYWPNITTVEASAIAEWIASTSIWKMYLNDYHVWNNKAFKPDLFGPDEDIPVWRLWPLEGWAEMAEALRQPLSNGIPPADATYDFNPHVTIPLRLAMKPPENLIIRPIHMWRGKRDPHPIVRK